MSLWAVSVVVLAHLSFAPIASAVNVLLTDVASQRNLVFTSAGTAILPEVPDAPKAESAYRNMGTGAAVGDYDADGDLDVYLLGHLGQQNRLFRNDLDLGLKRFTDVTPPALADLGFSRVAHFVDLDEDGDLDLLLVNDADQPPAGPPLSRSKIFRNDGAGQFTDVTAGSGFEPLGYLKGGCGLADVDGDGRIDIYVTNWTLHVPDQGPPLFTGSNRLYRNLGGLIFTDATTDLGLPGLSLNSFTPLFADFDEDHDADLLVALDNTEDAFFRNDGGHFMDVTTTVGADHVGNDMGVACADFDTDSDLDCFSTNITDPSGSYGTTQGNVLYENRLVPDGMLYFVDTALASGVFDTAWGWGTEAVDLENDGDVDLVAVTGMDEYVLEFGAGAQSPIYQTPGYVFLNDGSGQFSRLTGTGFDAPDDGRGLAAFDYDRDGDLDLLVTNRSQPVRLFENQTTGAGHWLGLKLGPDAKAIGAIVWVTVGNVTQRRDVIPGRSYLAGLPNEVHFGLGAAETVDRLEIEWADGFVQTLEDVPSDQWLELSWGATPVPTGGPLTLGLLSAMLAATATCLRRGRS